MPLKMGSIGCPEATAVNYQSALRNTSEERISHLLCGESLKSRIFFLFPYLNTRGVANINATSALDNYRMHTHCR